MRFVAYIVSLMLVGLGIGALARLIHPGRDPMGLWMTMSLGVISLVIAGLVFGGVLGLVVGIAVAVGLVAFVARRRRAEATPERPF